MSEFELPQRQPQAEPIELPEPVEDFQWAPPSPGETPVVEGGADYFDQLNKKQLKQHGRDVRLARKIFALADEDISEEPVEFIPTEEVTPRYKKATRELSASALRESKLWLGAMTNPVTGLPNRRAYDLALKERLVNRKEEDVAVAFMDLDGFKLINDTHGHKKGDEVMYEFGEELVSRVRESDIVIHFGGDEFAVIMPDYKRSEMPDAERDDRAKRRFRSAVTAVKEKLNINFGTSIGISHYEAGDTPETITARADAAMYEDKQDRKAS